MLDPYLFDDCHVLKNLLNIKDADLLERAEADYNGSGALPFINMD